jgi:hypothetical protein
LYKFFLYFFSNAGFVNKSIAVNAKVFAATSIPFIPKSVPPLASYVQFYQGTHDAVNTPTVGTT